MSRPVQIGTEENQTQNTAYIWIESTDEGLNMKTPMLKRHINGCFNVSEPAMRISSYSKNTS
jgi:hypothetical protein